MSSRVIRIGIASEEEIRKRTIEIASGRRRRGPKEPRIWFTSIRAVAEVLSDKNRELLKILANEKPESIQELSELSGRAESNLSRTLKTMEGYGLVRLERRNRHVRPVADRAEFEVRFG